MRRLLFSLAVVVALMSVGRTSTADYYIEYYRDNLFLGLAYHRVGCLTNGATIQSNQDYDGFTTTRYCVAGASSASVPNGSRYDSTYLSPSLDAARSRLDTCGQRTNAKYGTPGYAARSNTCGYNIVTNCNSDCWIRYFSTCNGDRVGIASPCFGYSYP
jgi:hypothetical protein